jgi:glycosyltransferase involved in cell wall biosynthesis
VGRVTLWSFSVLAPAMAGALVTGGLWLLAGASGPDWLPRAHRLLLGVALGSGAVMFLNLMVCYRFLVPDRDFVEGGIAGARVHVALTAFNDEQAIVEAVRDFKRVPEVHRLIVVDNASRDATARVALEAGADRVVIEPRPGYGSCCMRAMAEAAEGADVIVLCEGDCTFSGADIRKLLAYLENSDLVLGTRATQELRERGTQMDWLINPANQFVAKLVQLRFWGTRLTDVGCTYRAMRVDAYRRLAPNLHVRGNHFSPHMFIEALKLDLRVIEVPVTFRRRVGVSKGVGSSKLKAARVALRMLGLIYRA